MSFSQMVAVMIDPELQGLRDAVSANEDIKKAVAEHKGFLLGNDGFDVKANRHGIIAAIEKKPDELLNAIRTENMDGLKKVIEEAKQSSSAPSVTAENEVAPVAPDKTQPATLLAASTLSSPESETPDISTGAQAAEVTSPAMESTAADEALGNGLLGGQGVFQDLGNIGNSLMSGLGGFIQSIMQVFSKLMESLSGLFKLDGKGNLFEGLMSSLGQKPTVEAAEPAAPGMEPTAAPSLSSINRIPTPGMTLTG